MQQLDRISPPETSGIDHINLKQLSHFSLKNGAPVYYVNTPESQVLKLDFIFNAGLRNQKQLGQAVATNTLLSEGTSSYSAKELAEQLDKFGAYLQTKTNTDDSQITLFCLPRFLSNVLPFLLEVLTSSSLPEKELETYKSHSIQRLMINRQRNSFLGRRAFYASIFGKENAYGSPVNTDDYQNISRETVYSFYQENVLPGFKYILASGDVSETILNELDKTIGSLKNEPAPQAPIQFGPTHSETLFIENEFSVQSSIRIGCRFINRSHPDFHKLQLLNLSLGGFFGSRLMKNIREEKGLTYGIFSSLESYIDSGAFYIETEINNELRDTGVSEIFKELKRLRESPIPEQELSLVKNYMLGTFLRGIDGPFSLMDRHKMVLDYGFSYQYYQNFVDTVKQTSALELQHLANTYLKEESLTTIIVGKK